MGLFSKPVRSGLPEWDGMEFAPDDPRLPPEIRAHVRRFAGRGCVLLFSDTKDGGEWWLFDDAEELIDIFSLSR